MYEKIHTLDHPIFLQSIEFIRSHLSPNDLDPLQQKVLERLIHSSGDFALESLLRFSSGACEQAVSSLKAGAPILTDTAMAAAAVAPMARRTLNTPVRSVLDWAPDRVAASTTRTAVAIQIAWLELSKQFKGNSSPIVLIGSAPTALNALLSLLNTDSQNLPSLIIGMPVGFIGVENAKHRLMSSNCPYIALEGTRGGAGLAAATVNALLRESIDND